MIIREREREPMRRGGRLGERFSRGDTERGGRRGRRKMSDDIVARLK